jgi:hypothetical protein
MMISMDADKALRSNNGHLYLLRDSTQGHNGHGPNARPLKNGVGSIQTMVPSSEATSGPANGSDSPMYDDGLSAVRGMLLGVVLGAGFWALIAGLVGMLIF